MTKPTLSDLVGGELNEFGNMPPEEHMQKSLVKPDAPGAMTLGRINNVSKARMRHQMAQLLALEMPQIGRASCRERV